MKNQIIKPDISFDFYNQWGQLLEIGKCNWYTITPVQIELDYEEMLGKSVDITFIILGFGFTFYWRSLEKNEAYKEILEKAEKYNK